MFINQTPFYTDHLYKKLKPRSDVLENKLEHIEQELAKSNETGSLYNVSLPTQEDVWICGRVFSENAAGGGGKLNEHNVAIQGSYMCSNSQRITLNLAHCGEYSLFPGQIIMANGRNPEGRRFVCQEIIEPNFACGSSKPVAVVKKEAYAFESSREEAITVNVESGEDLNVYVVAGPFMQTGSNTTTALTKVIEAVKAKNNAHVLIILGPFVDLNHDLISTGHLAQSYEEILQSMLDEISAQFKNTKTHVVIQPSLNDITQDAVYPVAPFNVSNLFLRQNENIHLVPEPSMVKVNEIPIGITTTDVIKDLTSISVSKSHSSDKISRNFMHLLRQRSFYPIYPPPDHVCIDYEAWLKHAQIDTVPRVILAVSDLTTFNKEVSNCACVNPGRLTRGSSIGGYAHLVFTHKTDAPYQHDVNVSFQKIDNKQ